MAVMGSPQVELDRLWRRTTRVTIYDGGVSSGEPVTQKLLLAVSDESGLAALAGLLKVQASDVVCMCLGTLAFAFHDQEERRLAVIGFHHGVTLRWSGTWEYDQHLMHGDDLISWLDEHGVGGPADERRRGEARQLQRSVADEAWRQAAPACLSDVVEDLLATSNTGSIPAELVDDVARRLTSSIPEAANRVQALMRWFGTGEAKCSGYPVHESIPGTLLGAYPMSVLAASFDPHDQELAEGALRLFVGWEFRQRRSELVSLDEGQRTALAYCANESADPDKRSRFARVFSPG